MIKQKFLKIFAVGAVLTIAIASMPAAFSSARSAFADTTQLAATTDSTADTTTSTEDEDTEECVGDECGTDEVECTKDIWSCTWSACSANGKQTGSNCKLVDDCKWDKSGAPTSRSCTPPTDQSNPIIIPPKESDPVPPVKEDVCTWSCSGWGTCTNGVQYKTCTGTGNCITTRRTEKQYCNILPVECTWNCPSTWSECINGAQTRTCKGVGGCTTPTKTDRQKCVVTPPPSCARDTWDCSDWSACSSSATQSRTCKLVDDCKFVEDKKPAESMTCTYIPPQAPVPEPTPQPDPSPSQPIPTQPAPETPTQPICDRDIWTCGDWNACSADGNQTRTCSLEFRCESVPAFASPPTEQSCTVSEQAAPTQTDAAPITITEEEQRRQEELLASAEAEARRQTEEEIARRETAVTEQAQERTDQITEQTFINEAVPEVRELAREAVQTATPETQAARADVADFNQNDIPAFIEKEVGLSDTKPDEELVKLQAQLTVREHQLVSYYGKSAAEAKAIVKKEFKKTKAKRKVEVIRTYAKKKGVKIKDSKQGMEIDGASLEAKVLLGVNIKERAKKGDAFLPIEKKLYRLGDSTETGNKFSLSAKTGDKYSSKGFTILAAGPSNFSCTLTAIGKRGDKITLQRKQFSDNNKAVFAVTSDQSQKLAQDKYLFQLTNCKKEVIASSPAFHWLASAIDADGSAVENSAPQESAPALVEIVPDTEIPQPVIENIENTQIAGLSDIQITKTADGRVRVTGLSDISTIVVGSFSSAVFTSAILSDVENGSFEVVSPNPLAEGNHEIAIYATQPDENVQSPPVKLSFKIVPVAQAAALPPAKANGSTAPQRPSAENSDSGSGLPIGLIGGAFAVILAGIGITIWQKKNKSSSV